MRVSCLWLMILTLTGCSGSRNDSEVDRDAVESGSTLAGDTRKRERTVDDELPPDLHSGPSQTQKAQTDRTANAVLDPVATGLREAPVPLAAVRTVAFSRDSTRIALGTGEGEIAVWGIPEQEYLHQWTAHDHWVFDLIYDSRATRLFSAGGDNLTKIWSTENWQELASFADHDDDVHGVALTPDQNLLITGGDDTEVIVRNLKTETTKTLSGHLAQVTSVVLSPDGQTVFSSSRDQTVRVWDLNEFKEIAVLEGHDEDVLHLAIDRSGKYLASASYDGTARVWSTENFEPLATLKVSDEWVFAVAFSKDSSKLITGAGDGIVRVHRWETGVVTATYLAGSDVSDLAVSLTGSKVAVGTSMTGVHLLGFDGTSLTFRHKFGKESPSLTIPAALPIEESLSVQTTLFYETDSDEWGTKVGTLALTGDAFTLFLLKKLTDQNLPAPKRELAGRLKDKLQERFAKPQYHEFRTAWQQLAVAELLDLKIAEQLRPFAIERTTYWNSQLDNQDVILNTIKPALIKTIDETAEKHGLTDKGQEVEQKLFRQLDEVIEAD